MTSARARLVFWWVRCPDTRRDVLFYLLLAGVAGVEAAIGQAGGGRAASALAAVTVLVGPVALLLRSRRPLTSLFVACAVLVALAWAGASTGVAVTALAFVLLSAVGGEPGARPVPTFLLAAGAVSVTTLLEAGPGGLVARPVDFVFGTAGTAITVAVGVLLKQHRAALVELAERNAELDRLRVREAELAVEAERRRIARDMHDVVAHHVSAIAVRAHAARFVSGQQPDAPDAALAYIGTAASETLAALRGMIGALRTSDGVEAPLLPQPSLSDLGPLMGTLHAAGHDVRLRSPLPTDVPPDVALTAYRIVQESLTNALRHAPRAAVSIDVVREPGGLGVTVRNPLLHVRPRRDDPVAGSAPVPPGHGLPGMRERAHIAGGSLEAGPDGREWVVRALLPTPAAAPTASWPAGAVPAAPARTP